MSGKSTPPSNEAQQSGAPICDESERSGWRADIRRPVLFVDIDGVISLFGFGSGDRPEGGFHWIDGIVHYIGTASSGRLARLAERYELVWASGWEEKANEYLPHILNLAGELPCLYFDGRAVFGTAHWKLEAIEEYAGDRPAAWIDDNLDHRCDRWATRRRAPTLLIETDPAVGITDEHVDRLLRWADEVAPRS